MSTLQQEGRGSVDSFATAKTGPSPSRRMTADFGELEGLMQGLREENAAATPGVPTPKAAVHFAETTPSKGDESMSSTNSSSISERRATPHSKLPSSSPALSPALTADTTADESGLGDLPEMGGSPQGGGGKRAASLGGAAAPKVSARERASEASERQKSCQRPTPTSGRGKRAGAPTTDANERAGGAGGRVNDLPLLHSLRSRTNDLIPLRSLRSRTNDLLLLHSLRSRTNDLIPLRSLRSRTNDLLPLRSLRSLGAAPSHSPSPSQSILNRSSKRGRASLPGNAARPNLTFGPSSTSKKRSRRSVAFGSPQAAEFNSGSPSTKLTPMPSPAAKQQYVQRAVRPQLLRHATPL
jgi:hypothetical protein